MAKQPSGVAVGAALAVWLAMPCIAPAHTPRSQELERLTRLVDERPGDAALLVRRGDLHYQRRSYARALDDYDRAAKLAPDLVIVDYHRARAMLDQGRVADAKARLEVLLDRMPEHQAGHVLLARALVKNGEHADAAIEYTLAISLVEAERRPRVDHFLERARAQVVAGDVDAALAGLDEGVRRLGAVTLELEALELEAARGHVAQALTRLDAVAAKAQRQERWLKRRAELLESADRPREAVAAYQAALVALESLPPSRRQTTAMTNLEHAIREGLGRLSPLEGTEGTEHEQSR